MKKILWMCIVFYAFLPIHGQEKATQSDAGKKTSDHSEQRTSLVTVTVVNENGSKDEERKPKDDSQGYLRELIAPNNLPNLLLVAVGIGAIIYASKTVIATKEAAKATQAAAAASLEQADLMASQNKASRDRERVRLTLDRVDVPQITKTSYNLFGTSMRVQLWLINDGSTQGFNVRAAGAVEITKHIEAKQLTTITATSEWYGLEIPQTIRGFGVANPIPVVVTQLDGFDSDSIQLEKGIYEGLRNKERSMSIVGEVAYEDVYGDEHRTPFHLIWTVHGVDVGGIWPTESKWYDLSQRSI